MPAQSYLCSHSDERVSMSGAARAIFLRGGVEIDDPVEVLLGFLESAGYFEIGDPSRPEPFDEVDLRMANRGGARISGAQIAEILERRKSVQGALEAIAPGASLAGPARSVPWGPLRELFDAFAGIRGVGLSKMTKALHGKRPALVPMLDSVVQKYLEDDDPGPLASFGERAVGFVHGYKADLDRNRAAVKTVKRELNRRNYALTEVRILDLLIWSAK